MKEMWRKYDDVWRNMKKYVVCDKYEGICEKYEEKCRKYEGICRFGTLMTSYSGILWCIKYEVNMKEIWRYNMKKYVENMTEYEEICGKYEEIWRKC